MSNNTRSRSTVRTVRTVPTPAPIVLTPISTKDLNDVRVVCQNIGDNFATDYYQNKDIRVGMAAIAAYGAMAKMYQLQILNKKMTGFPEEIQGFSYSPKKKTAVKKLNKAA